MSALYVRGLQKSDPRPLTQPVTEKKLKGYEKQRRGATTVYNITHDAVGRLLSYKKYRQQGVCTTHLRRGR